MSRMDLKAYLEQAPYGEGARLARALNVTGVMVSTWASGARPVPEDRAPWIEWHTGFLVRVETSCPDKRWHRVRDPAWPHGKPLLDKTPLVVKLPGRVRRYAAVAQSPSSAVVQSES